MISIIRASARGIWFVLLLSGHIFAAILPTFFRPFKLPYALYIRRLWVGRSLRMLGVKLEVQGQIPKGRYIFAGNHRSYLDPAVVLRDVEALPVAKAEVADWPLIGYGAKVTGIMFVQRDSKSSRASTLDAMRKTLQMGFPVLVYPEGTTHTLPHTMEFRGGGFGLAVKEQVPVVPMAIEYFDMRDAWVGDDTFMSHFVRCFGKKRTYIKIRYGQPIPPGDDSAALMALTKTWIDKNLAELRQEFDQSPPMK